MSSFRVVLGAATDRGRHREKNEDRWGAENRGGQDGRTLRGIYVVADGMGGARGGDTASHLAVGTIVASLNGASGSASDALIAGIKRANGEILSLSRSTPELRGMGTTCVALALDEGRAAIAHVGDSRAYLLRNGRLHRLTRDHTLRNEIAEQFQDRQPQELPERHILSRCLGVQDRLRIDVRRLETTLGDRFVLCSDGLYEHVRDEEISAIVDAEEPDQAATSLVALANERGGIDNITVVVVDVAPMP